LLRSALGRIDEHPTALLAAILLLPFGLRLALAWAVGVAPDEAYYHGWSLHLAAGYPDHPPAVAWLIAASTRVAGAVFDDRLVVRLPAVAIGGIALPCVLYWLGREAGVSGRARALLPLASVAQPLGVAAGLFMTPDVPLILCWALAATLALRATRLGGTAAWVLAGLAVGGSLLSKHSGWLLLASIAVGIVVDPLARRQLRRPGPWLGLGLALLVATPNLAWDASTGFSSLGFQLRHGLDPSPSTAALLMAPVRLVELLAGQIGLLTPLVAWACWRGVRRGAPPRPAGPMLWALAVVPVAAFCVAALLAHPEANWPAPAHPLLLALALSWLGADREGGAAPDRHGRFVAAAAWSSAALTALAAIHLLWPLPGFPPAQEPAARLRAWDDQPRWLSPPTGPLHADGYELAAALSFNLPSRPVVRTACEPSGECPAGAIVVVAGPGSSCPEAPEWFRREGHRVAEIGAHPMHRRDGAVVRTLCGFRLTRTPAAGTRNELEILRAR
jgi:dolichol-phosphate mannosyltransferase